MREHVLKCIKSTYQDNITTERNGNHFRAAGLFTQLYHNINISFLNISIIINAD